MSLHLCVGGSFHRDLAAWGVQIFIRVSICFLTSVLVLRMAVFD